MKRGVFGERLHGQMQGVHVNAALRQRALLAAQGKDVHNMKRKPIYAAVFALLAVLLCAAALAAANRWGMLDFAGRYSGAYIPEDAQNYVQTNVLTMENEWATVNIRELYYDGRIARMTADVTPKGENVLLVGEDTCMDDLFINLTHEYVVDGENDMRSVFQFIQDEGYTDVYVANVSLTGGHEMIMGSMDYILGEDGTLTIYSEREYAQDLPEREAQVHAILMPYAKPLSEEAYADYAARRELEESITLRCAQPAEVYVSEAPVDFPSVGVRVDNLTIEVKPQEIYATIEYTITDRAKYDETDGGLWFEFIDPESAETEPHQQRLSAGLSGGGSAGPVDGDNQTATRYKQQETLGKNELHDVYTLRAYDVWEKGRYEAHEIAMRPAAEDDPQ